MMRRLAIALFLLLAIGAGVAAASIVMPAGSDTAGEPASVAPDGGPVYLDGEAEDPRGGPRWTTRMYSSKSGHSCTQAGRVLDGRFGRLDADGSFTQLPVAAAGTCTPPESDSLVVVVNRYYGPEAGGGRTVVFGTADRTVATLELQTPSEAVAVQRGERGGFVAVHDSLSANDVTLTAVLVDGTTKQFRLERREPSWGCDDQAAPWTLPTPVDRTVQAAGEIRSQDCCSPP